MQSLADWEERGRQKPWRLLMEFSPCNVKQVPALPLHSSITKSCYGISSSVFSAFCFHFRSRMNCLVVCIIGKWYAGGARSCLNWYSHLMYTTGLLLCEAATFLTSVWVRSYMLPKGKRSHPAFLLTLLTLGDYCSIKKLTKWHCALHFQVLFPQTGHVHSTDWFHVLQWMGFFPPQVSLYASWFLYSLM